MRFLLLICAVLFYSSALAQYQNLTLKTQPVTSTNKPFKLTAQEENLNYEPSDVGIIGIKYLHQAGAMSTVIEVYPHTPAEAAGVRVGDKLLEVNGVGVTPLDTNQVYALIAGLPGTPISLKFMRCNYYGADCQIFPANLTRMDMNKLNSDRIFRIYKYGQ